jgi:hypothetical protein
MKYFFLAFLLTIALALRGATVIETEKVKELKPTGSLGTCSYAPAAVEKPYFSKLPKSEVVTGSFMEPYSIHNKKDVNVSWFAIVRGITPEPDSNKRFTLLLEQKFFDGMTDCHIMLVSVAGGGDFRATVETDGAQSISALALVRVYGVVTKEEAGVPTVTADYIRVWPWHTFTLTDLGPEDKGNPKWRKLCRLCKSGHVYNPYPAENYYLNVLGDPADFALQPRKEQPSH